MSQHRKHRGYKTSRNVAREFQEAGWVNCYSVGAGEQGSDIKNLPFDVEVKAVTNLSIPALFRQIEARTTGLGFGVARLNGQGDNAGQYAAIIRLSSLIQLLKDAGYLKSDKSQPIRCTGCGGWMMKGLDCSTCQNMNTNA